MKNYSKISKILEINLAYEIKIKLCMINIILRAVILCRLVTMVDYDKMLLVYMRQSNKKN